MFTDKLVFAQRYNKTYNAAELTKEDIAAIDTYWAQFGIKFEDYSWFRWFYSVTGKKDPKHNKQLNDYISAIKSMTDKEVRGCLVYLSEEGIEVVDN